MNKNIRHALLLLAGFLFLFILFVVSDVVLGWKDIGWAICSNFFIVFGGGLWYLIFEHKEPK